MAQRTIPNSLSSELPTSRPSAPHRIDKRAFQRSLAGTRLVRQVDGGSPTRSNSGEWMQRIALDLPEVMLDLLTERAGGDQTVIGELIRAGLVRAGIGDASHVCGIRDGDYADDEEHRSAQAELARFDEDLQARLSAREGGR